MTERFRFTHDKITRVASREDRFIVWDSTHRGLGLRVTPRGTRSFIVAYRFNGRPRMLTLGNSPPLTLEQALERYSDALKTVAQARHMRVHEHETPPAELDPASRKRERREARRTAGTVSELWAAYKVKRLAGIRGSTAKEYDRIIDVYVTPELGDNRADDVRTRDIKRTLNKVAETGPVMANRVHSLLAALFSYAKNEFIIEANPVKDVKTPTKEQRRQRALDSEAELRGFFAGLDAMPSSAPVKVALAMVLATAARSGEVCSMRRSDIDFDAAIWTIPATVDKTNKARRVPLSPFALDLLKRSKAFMLDADVVFPSGRRERSISASTLSRALVDHRQNFAENKVAVFCPHDLRRTARTWLSKLRVSRDIAEMCLGHVVGNAIERTYNVDDRLPEIREALDKLGAHLDIMRAGENVVALPMAANG